MIITNGLTISDGQLISMYSSPYFIGNTASTTTVTIYGSASIISNTSPISTTAYSLNGTTDYLTIAASSNFAMGTGDFTMEWFQYMTSQTSNPRVFSLGNYSSASAAVSIESDGAFYVWEDSGFRFSYSLTNYLNQWVHFAISRISGQTSVYQNGIQLGSTYSDSNILGNGTSLFAIGQESSPTSGSYFPGYITGFRVCKGLGVYSGNFTVPTSKLGQTAGPNPYGGSNTNAITTECVLLLQP
jgi:hypothetical protein